MQGAGRPFTEGWPCAGNCQAAFLRPSPTNNELTFVYTKESLMLQVKVGGLCRASHCRWCCLDVSTLPTYSISQENCTCRYGLEGSQHL